MSYWSDVARYSSLNHRCLVADFLLGHQDVVIEFPVWCNRWDFRSIVHKDIGVYKKRT